MELYLTMVYDYVGTRNTYQSVRLSGITNLAAMQTSMFKCFIKYPIYKYITSSKFEHRRLYGCCQICTSSTKSDRLVWRARVLGAHLHDHRASIAR